MIKNSIRGWCQKLLGFDRYLFFFARVNIARIRFLGHEKEFRFFNAMIKDDGTILDIGANIGIMTVSLAKQHPGSMIYSFEPIPANEKALQKTVGFFKLQNVKIMATALGDRDGEINMVMPVLSGSKMQGLSHIIESGVPEQGELFSVPIKKMDDIPELQQLQKISAIKIDVENFEYYVLKGGETLIKKHRPVIFCELWSNERRADCFELIKSFGYQVKVLDNGALVDFNGQPSLNYFFYFGVIEQFK